MRKKCAGQVLKASPAPTRFCPADPSISPTYTSAGRLLARPAGSSQDMVLCLAGRPVARLGLGSGPPTWTYLTTDHLGTPVLATNATGAETWHGGFDPFGGEFTTPTASSAGVFLRLPGQWSDDYWSASATLGAGIYQNLHRWYEPGTGGYSQPDPLRSTVWSHAFLYALANPLRFGDLLGLRPTTVGCRNGPCPATSDPNSRLDSKRVLDIYDQVLAQGTSQQVQAGAAGVFKCFDTKGRTLQQIRCLSRDECPDETSLVGSHDPSQPGQIMVCDKIGTDCELGKTIAHEIAHTCFPDVGDKAELDQQFLQFVEELVGCGD